MKIINPKYVAPPALKTRSQMVYELVDVIVQNLPEDKQDITFDEIRKRIDGAGATDQTGKLKGADVTDAMIQAVASGNSWSVNI